MELGQRGKARRVWIHEVPPYFVPPRPLESYTSPTTNQRRFSLAADLYVEVDVPLGLGPWAWTLCALTSNYRPSSILESTCFYSSIHLTSSPFAALQIHHQRPQSSPPYTKRLTSQPNPILIPPLPLHHIREDSRLRY